MARSTVIWQARSSAGEARTILAAPENGGIAGEFLALDDLAQVQESAAGTIRVRLDGQAAMATSAICSA